MKKIKKVTMGGQECDVHIGEYTNGKTYIELVCSGGDDDGAPYLMATTNIQGVDLDKPYLLIKNYSENQGVLNVLTKAGIIEDTGKKIKTGFTNVNICKLIK